MAFSPGCSQPMVSTERAPEPDQCGTLHSGGPHLPSQDFLRSAPQPESPPTQSSFLPLSPWVSELHHSLKVLFDLPTLLSLLPFPGVLPSQSLACLIPSWYLLLRGPKLVHTWLLSGWFNKLECKRAAWHTSPHAQRNQEPPFSAFISSGGIFLGKFERRKRAPNTCGKLLRECKAAASTHGKEII